MRLASSFYLPAYLRSVNVCLRCTGDTFHLLHVVPEPSMIHVWPGMYVPPDDDAEQDEVLTPSFCPQGCLLKLQPDCQIHGELHFPQPVTKRPAMRVKL